MRRSMRNWATKLKPWSGWSKAERIHDDGLTFLRCLWKFDPIREEPQFKAIEARMHFPPP